MSDYSKNHSIAKPATSEQNAGDEYLSAGSSVSAFDGGLEQYTKSASFLSSNSQIELSILESRIRRFALQSVARRVLLGDKVERVTAGKETKMVTRWRVCWCLRRIGRDTVHNGADFVAIDYSPSAKSAHYANLMVCGRLWQCPVCAAKISEVRRVELQTMMELVRSAGISSFMVTYTLRHKKDDRLSDLLKKLNEARRFLKSGEYYKRFESQHQVMGSVRSVELTYGANGWHPHVHELFISSAPAGTLDTASISDYLKGRWERCAQKFGFEASWEHGVDVGFEAGWVEEYIAKFGKEPAWQESHELAKQVSKVARTAKGRTPFQLLESEALGERVFGQSPGGLFREYVLAFEGKRQLYWSKGLRAAFGLGVEQDDEELAASLPDDSYLLAIVDLIDWSIILRHEQRAQLLAVARTGDAGAVVQFINHLRKYHFRE